jgi:hypothetical protein
MKPMKLIAVFVHEFSHATACWMTGGKVTGMEVNSNEGGVTKYVGGWRWFIIPAGEYCVLLHFLKKTDNHMCFCLSIMIHSNNKHTAWMTSHFTCLVKIKTEKIGYIGGSFWGAFFIVLSGDRTASFISAILFCIALLFSLKYSPNKTMVLLNLMFVVITITFIVVDRTLTHPFLQYLTLFYGVFIGSFSIFDIYDDLITRTVEGSDAHACHKLIPCCLPKCVGVQFALIAFAWQVLGVYLALVWMSSSS